MNIGQFQNIKQKTNSLKWYLEFLIYEKNHEN